MATDKVRPEIIAVYSNPSGITMVKIGDADYLLYFPTPKIHELPKSVTVSANALVSISGNSFCVWHKDDEDLRASGGELVNGDERVHIADLLRESLPENDPRWRDQPPKCSATEIGLEN